MDYRATIEVGADVSTASRAICADMDKWWTRRVEQNARQATVRFRNSHATFTFDPDATEQYFAWTFTDVKMIIEGVADHAEWVGTKLIWELEPSDTGSRMTLTHQGLNQTLECHGVCTTGWERYFENSLKAHLNGGMPTPETA